MKILVLTAVFGGVDTPKPFSQQTLPDGVTMERLVITEANSPFPLPNLPDRLKGKYFKCVPFDEEDIVIWIDGNIEVTDEHFVAKMIEPIVSGLAHITIQNHHERQTIGQEINFILESENPYLTVRYRNQPLKAEYEYYLSKGMPPDAPLYSCNVFAYKNGVTATEFLQEWFHLCLQWSWFDQSAFSFLAWKYNKRIGCALDPPPTVQTVDLGGVLTSPYFKLHSHDNWQR